MLNINSDILKNLPEINQKILEEYVAKNMTKEVKIHLHAVLTYKNVIREMDVDVKYGGCINRDKNAVLNMEKIVKSLLETGSVPEIFKRTPKRVNRVGKKRTRTTDSIRKSTGVREKLKFNPPAPITIIDYVLIQVV